MEFWPHGGLVCSVCVCRLFGFVSIVFRVGDGGRAWAGTGRSGTGDSSSSNARLRSTRGASPSVSSLLQPTRSTQLCLSVVCPSSVLLFVFSLYHNAAGRRNDIYFTPLFERRSFKTHPTSCLTSGPREAAGGFCPAARKRVLHTTLEAPRFWQ